MFLPTLEFVHHQKSFPLWNPNICCGVPNLASIQFGLLFPIRILFAWLDPFAASAPIAFTKLCLAGWFTMMFARSLGVRVSGAFLSAVAFSLCGFMIVWLGHPLVSSAMWLPLLLYFVEKSFVAQSPRTQVAPWLGFSVALSFMILGGHPPTALHVGLVVAAYFVYRAISSKPRRALVQTGLLAAGLAVGLLLAAPQLLPYLEYYQYSSSAAASHNLARWSEHQELPTFIQFFLPNVLGNPGKGYEDLPTLLNWPHADVTNAINGYVGIVPLFFAGWATAFRRCGSTIFFAALAAIALLIVYAAPPFPFLMRTLPLLSDINHTRLLFVVAFSVAILAGLGWDEFNRGKNPAQVFAFTTGFSVVVAGAVWFFWSVAGARFNDLNSQHRGYIWYQFLILALGLIVIGIVVVWPLERKRFVPMTLGIVWAAADLLFFGHGFNPAISRELYYPTTEGIEWLQKDQSLFRIFGGDVLHANSAEAFGLADVRGSDTMAVRRYEELVTGREGDIFFYLNADTMPAAFPLLNAKYLLLSEPVALDPEQFEVVYSKEIAIYRFKSCLARALLVNEYEVEANPLKLRARVTSHDFDPTRKLLLEDQPEDFAVGGNGQSSAVVKINSYKPDDVTIDATLDRPGFVLLLDTYFPGWTATVNGRPAKIYRADYNFRAVQLPPGQSKLCFAYRPVSFRIGLWLAAASIFVLVGGGIACLRSLSLVSRVGAG